MRTYALAGGGYVKVGRTTDLVSRMRTLGTGAPFPLELLGHVDGDVEVEVLLELRRTGQHSHGEWFRDTPSVRRVLRLRGLAEK